MPDDCLVSQDQILASLYRVVQVITHLDHRPDQKHGHKRSHIGCFDLAVSGLSVQAALDNMVFVAER